MRKLVQLLAAHPAPAFLLALWGCAIIFIIGASTQPTIAGDEYAYWATANQRLFGFAPTQYDPMLQSPGDTAYVAIIATVRRYFDDGVLAMRLFQVLVYVGALIFVARSAHPSTPNGMAWTLAIALSSPFALFVTPVMPEAFFFATAAVAIVLAARSQGLVGGIIGCALAGAAAGQALFLKPHAMALITGIVVAAPLIALPAPGARALRAIANLGACVVGVAVSIFVGLIVWRSGSLIGAGYTSFLPGGSAGQGEGGSFIRILVAFLGQAITGIVLAGPAAFAPLLLSAFRRTVAPLNSTAGRIWIVSLAALGASLMMTAVFSAQVGAQSAFEANRIFARYFGFYPTLVGVSALAVLINAREPTDGLPLRIAAGVYAAFLAVFLLWVWPAFKFYPWDVPWLTSLIRPGAKYWPSWHPSADLSLIVVGLLVAAVIAALVFSRHLRFAHVGFLVVLNVAGGIATLWWVDEVRDDHRVAFQEMRAFSTLAASNTSPNQGVIVLDDRYGSGVQALWGVTEPERVVTLAKGSPLTEANIPADAMWILMLDRYDVNVPYAYELRGQRVRLLMREGARPRVLQSQPPQAAAATAAPAEPQP